MGRKVSDEWVVPLCALHHRALHDCGNEPNWWQEQELDPITEALRLWGRSHPQKQVGPDADRRETRDQGTNPRRHDLARS